jgi:site-specific DNA-adenine methylase
MIDYPTRENSDANSLLRFPGGKTPVAKQLADYFDTGRPLLEPFAGSAAVGVEMLRRGCPQVYLADTDPTVFRMWQGMKESDPDEVCGHLPKDPTVGDFYAAKAALDDVQSLSVAQAAAVKIVVQRCSYGGYGCGAYGGKDQSGKGKIGDRWNYDKVVATVEEYRDLLQRATLWERDGFDLLEHHPNIQCFIDPPYHDKGRGLYPGPEFDHNELGRVLRGHRCLYVATLDRSTIGAYRNPNDPSQRRMEQSVSGNRRNSPEWVIVGGDD